MFGPMTTATIPDVFAASVARFADHTALRDGDRAITYRELGSAVAAAAAHPVLAPRPAEDEPPVAVLAPLGIDGLVVQLAVLCSGRICAPLEVSLPVPRLVAMIGSIGGVVICLDDEVTTALTAAGVACVDTADLRLDVLCSAPPVDLVAPDGDGDTAALVCFTSGSTGDPKGVVLPHSQLVEAARFTGSDENDVVAITSPPSFFASMLQTLTALGVGATGIHLDLATQSGARLHDIARDVGLTHVTGTTTHIRELARASVDEPLVGLRAVDLGGEPTTADDIDLFRRAFPRCRVRNIFGSSETGRITTLDIGPDDDPLPPGPIPAGRTDGARVLELFDDDDRPVPPGRTGRIAVLRPEPFLGYWRDPALTASRVVLDDDGREWILSGDRGRLDEDGLLHVVGRIDDLVRIRGRFVHPGDIDAILERDPRVDRAVTVAVPPDAPVRLHTIVVPADPSVTPADLREALSGSLPLFALPRHIVLVDRLPVTSRGKPDRAALADIPVTTGPSPGSAPAEARTISEVVLLGLFRDILRSDVSVHDDFFAAGGDSLAAIELLTILADEFGARVSPARLVAHPTPAALAELLDRGPDDGTSIPDLVRLHDGDHPTSTFWILGTVEGFGPARLAHHNAPIGSWFVRAVGSGTDERPLPTLAAIGAHNATVIERARTERTVLIGYSAGTLLALETAVAMARRGTRPDLLVLVDPPTRESAEIMFRRPSPFRRPVAAARALVSQHLVLHRPFDSEDPAVVAKRLQRRHGLLWTRHAPTPYDGPTVVILTQEFAGFGGTALVEAGLTRPPERIVIPGTHVEALLDPEPLATALDRLLRQHDLL